MFKKSSFLVLACFALLSCGSERNYYVLSPAGKTPLKQGIGLGIGPINMADYLVERPYLIFQSSPYKMEMSDLHEWSGDLSDNFGRVLGTNLGRRLGTGNIHSYPSNPKSKNRYQIAVDLNQFHGDDQGDAVLEASWRVYALPGSTIVRSHTSTLRCPLEKDGYESLVAAQSILVDMLSAEIAAAIR